MSFQIGQRAHETDIAGRKRIGLAQLTQGDVLRRPFADPAYGLQPLNRVVEPAAGTQQIGIGDDSGGDGGERGRPASRHAEGRQVRARQYLRPWEDVGQITIRLRQGLSMCGNQAPGQTDRGGNRDLLSQHRADRQLEAVPGAGHAQTRSRLYQRGQSRILGEMGGDGKRIGGQVEDAAQPRDDPRQCRQPGKADARPQRILLRQSNGNDSRPAAQLDGSRVTVLGDAGKNTGSIAPRGGVSPTRSGRS